MDAYVPDEAVPAEVGGLLAEPDPSGDVVDFLILAGIALALALSFGATLFFIDAVWDLVGMGEGAPPASP